ncbi:hypothetical protein AgCh_018742 [Apium graveolens]
MNLPSRNAFRLRPALDSKDFKCVFWVGLKGSEDEERMSLVAYLEILGSVSTTYLGWEKNGNREEVNGCGDHADGWVGGVEVDISDSIDSGGGWFIFLHNTRLFLTLRNKTVALWNLSGEVVTLFKDHLLGYPGRSFKNVYVTASQDLIIFLCRAQLDDLWLGQNAGSIKISNILTGKCLAKINARNTSLIKEFKCSGRRCNLSKPIKGTEIKSTLEDALKDNTSIFYDGERGEIYTGQLLGLVRVWSN